MRGGSEARWARALMRGFDVLRILDLAVRKSGYADSTMRPTPGFCYAPFHARGLGILHHPTAAGTVVVCAATADSWGVAHAFVDPDRILAHARGGRGGDD